MEMLGWTDPLADQFQAVMNRYRAGIGTGAAWRLHALGQSREQVTGWLSDQSLVGGEGWVTNRMNFIEAPERAVLIWSYWWGERVVAPAWRRVEMARRPDFLRYLYGRMHSNSERADVPNRQGRTMRSSHLISVAASLLLLSACALSVEHEERGARISDLEVQVDHWAQAALDEGVVAGISVAVEHDGELLVAKGYGMADLEQDVAASKNTVYRIGSITKQFTAAAIMQLVEAGQVRLDAPIQEYVDFPTGDHEVTVEQLLHHTSGIKSYTGLGEEWTRTVPLDIAHDELLGMVVDKPFDFSPGEEWRYNNSGYYLLGVIVENVTNGTYPDYVEQTLAAPLGLERTTYCDEKRLIPGRAEGYELEEGELVNDDSISMTQPFAAGSLCSTVLDLLRWQAALESGEVVSDDSYAQMTTEGLLNDGESTGYGYGLGVGELDGHLRVSHGGGINGFVTHLASYPDDEPARGGAHQHPRPDGGPTQ